MFASFLAGIVELSRKFAAFVVLGALIATVALGGFVIRNMAINTDINQLLSDDLAWRKQEKELERAFPQKVDTLVIVIDGDSAVLAEKAASALARQISVQADKFISVVRPDALPFFRTHGLLYLSTEELADSLDQIAQAQPMFGATIADPSLRGFMGMLRLMAQGVEAGAIDSDYLERPFVEIEKALQAVLDKRPYALDLRKMMPEASDPFAERERRRYLIAKPVLDYSSLQPGRVASMAVRKAAADLGFSAETGVRVRLTGSVALNDDEFSSIAEGTGLAVIFSGVLVFSLLFAAMGSWRIVLPIALTLVVGLVASTAFALCVVGSLNLISVAFAVMFVGMAVDFGIQFGTRYRDEHVHEPDHAKAMKRTAEGISAPLAMAAGATMLGFFAFLPTDYRGVSELGLIAGSAMAIAFFLNITFLPALMTLLKPSAEAEAAGFSCFAPLNGFLIKRSRLIVVVLLILGVISAFIAARMRFDFDPLNLKDPQTESVSTMFEVMRDPDSDAYAAQILASSEEEAAALVSRLELLPEVDRVMTINSFIPEEQEEKLAMIEDTALLFQPTFALSRRQAPSEEENRDALRETAGFLRQGGGGASVAERVGRLLDLLAEEASSDDLLRAKDVLLEPIQAKLGEVQALLDAKTVMRTNIPTELARDWVAEDGKMLIQVFPKRGVNNNPRDPQMLTRFIDAVSAVAPSAAGTPVSIRESGRTIVRAFVEGGLYGFVSIALFSFLILRRIRDVLLMFVPLALAGILTLATMVAIGLPLNFANIIALPLLFSLGVSYGIYFVFWARQGRMDFLQSSMARAVFFSAVTTLVAFGSLGFSSHPGTRGMGELLTISLLYSLACTFFVLPVLYGLRGKDGSS